MKKFSGSKSRILTGTALLLAILSFLISCSESTDNTAPGPGPVIPGGPEANEVWIQDMAFNPATITVPAGTTIKWTNKDGTAHTVTSDAGSAEIFNSTSMANGATFTWKFNSVGTFNYHCSLHTGMKAKVVVN